MSKPSEFMSAFVSPVRTIAVALLTCLALTLPAIAERRVALIIGNGAYPGVGDLRNPPRDAAALETMFKAAGFDVVRRFTDLDVAGMRRALRDFAEDVQDADIAVVFFAGHGIEVNGTNYLVPSDAKLVRDIDVQDETIALDRVSQVIEHAKRLRLVILDACRDNPFVRSMRRTVATRSIGRGLANVEVLASDTLIAYAAKGGSVADDGDGANNSPYTTALLKHLATPGLDVRLSLGRVRDEVLRTTGRRQEPFVYGSLGGAEISLVAATDGRALTADQPPKPRHPAAGVWRRDIPEASASFGGAPFCAYRVTMKNLTLTATIGDDGFVSRADLTATTTESTVGQCAVGTIDPHVHRYTGTGTLAGDKLTLDFTPSVGNQPKARVNFSGRLVGRDPSSGRLVGTLVLQRSDIGGNLAWTIRSELK